VATKEDLHVMVAVMEEELEKVRSAFLLCAGWFRVITVELKQYFLRSTL